VIKSSLISCYTIHHPIRWIPDFSTDVRRAILFFFYFVVGIPVMDRPTYPVVTTGELPAVVLKTGESREPSKGISSVEEMMMNNQTTFPPSLPTVRVEYLFGSIRHSMGISRASLWLIDIQI
jgi:hypothetical protein